ncbi:lactococcin 972 family bacteriocin [Enterococcus faecalis]|uniref:lactococcin 972 family bacteriocin n=1 Tax=Enterococcus TaxID=1350 RepID=UPI00053BF992|nr:lactococcin 972 family bacteriocin [Enterococcus faecalis]EGO5014717.1 lactococcin 972 family bacteriocin [Enterococcus faecalis]EKO5957223.1 lactococcin 972 family bacteriocin [Enterococcus faecalis]KII42439.1 hypothetical protein QR18_05675 [Enterococcus faecalis]HBI2085704.1 lactococcin 972 family bacteriocin [Enterococcus faecalis]HBK4586044.1 lactococcin 972 family bacteriocin [Enterococcus faecalis]
MKKIVVFALSLIVLATGGASVVQAATEYPDGGTWNYGVGATGSYSDYLHNTKAHSATVSKGDDKSSQSAKKGSWAKARLTIYSGCNFYYNYW